MLKSWVHVPGDRVTFNVVPLESMLYAELERFRFKINQGMLHCINEELIMAEYLTGR